MNIRWQLTLLRDKKWMPHFLVDFIDWLRYGIFNDNELQEEDVWDKQEDKDIEDILPIPTKDNK